MLYLSTRGDPTNVDLDGSSDDDDGFDDDFAGAPVSGLNGYGEVGICFRADRTATGTTHGSKVGASWDDASVFVVINVPGSGAGAGFQRSTGLRAAAASSRRPMRVECGAFKTSSGSSRASFAIARMASMN